MSNEQRGLRCDVCERPFAGDPGETTVLWEKDSETTVLWEEDTDRPGPEVLFLHKACLTEAIERAYVCSGGGAWSAKQDQIDSVDRLLMKETLLYQDRKACERYREFCRSCPARKRARVEEATPLTQFDNDHEAAWLRDGLQADGGGSSRAPEASEPAARSENGSKADGSPPSPTTSPPYTSPHHDGGRVMTYSSYLTVADLKAIGLRVYVQDGQLVVGPASEITRKLHNAIVADREALLAEVYREPQPK